MYSMAARLRPLRGGRGRWAGGLKHSAAGCRLAQQRHGVHGHMPEQMLDRGGYAIPAAPVLLQQTSCENHALQAALAGEHSVLYPQLVHLLPAGLQSSCSSWSWANEACHLQHAAQGMLASGSSKCSHSLLVC
jgi:hypothetical protein